MGCIQLTDSAHSGEANYQACHSCVMDTTAPEITFDDDGSCSFCLSSQIARGVSWFPEHDGFSRFAQILEAARPANGSRGKFDCIVGLSGGLDSSVTAVRLAEAGLRLLAVDVDAGWNSEQSVENIRRITNGLGVPLETVVIDWSAMQKLQTAFMWSGVLNQDTPQDHSFKAALPYWKTPEGTAHQAR